MNIINLDQLVSMTSLEIAELTDKRHDNVIRDVRKMVEELNGLKSEEVNGSKSEGVNGSNFGRVDEEMYKDAPEFVRLVLTYPWSSHDHQ